MKDVSCVYVLFACLTVSPRWDTVTDASVVMLHSLNVFMFACGLDSPGVYVSVCVGVMALAPRLSARLQV